VPKYNVFIQRSLTLFSDDRGPCVHSRSLIETYFGLVTKIENASEVSSDFVAALKEFISHTLWPQSRAHVGTCKTRLRDSGDSRLDRIYDQLLSVLANCERYVLNAQGVSTGLSCSA
jgi:hypothetical protein